MTLPSFLEPGSVRTVTAIRRIVYWTFILIFFVLLLDASQDWITAGPETILGMIFISAALMIYIETLFERNILEFPSRLDTLPVAIGAFSGSIALMVGIGLTFRQELIINLFEPFMTYVYLKTIIVLLYAWIRGDSKDQSEEDPFASDNFTVPDAF